MSKSGVFLKRGKEVEYVGALYHEDGKFKLTESNELAMVKDGYVWAEAMRYRVKDLTFGIGMGEDGYKP